MKTVLLTSSLSLKMTVTVTFITCVTLCIFNSVVTMAEVLTLPVMPESRDVYPFYVSSAIRGLHENILIQFYDRLVNEGLFFNGNDARAAPPLDLKTPEELKNLLNFTLGRERADHSTLLDYISTIIRYSPKASHPYKVDRHAVGLDPYALLADFMGSITGSPMAFLFGPMSTLMEWELGHQVRSLIGYPEGKGDSLIAPGTGIGTGLAIHVALQHKFPGFKKTGFKGMDNQSSRVVLFLSEHAATSYNKQFMWTGIGLNGCIRVKTDDRGRMNITDLEEKIKISIEKGETPFLIISSAGTQILGSIDPIDEIVKVAKKYGNLWVHVDGFLAGSNFLSDERKHTLKGIEQSDSFLWSTDKTLSTPFTAVVFVTRHEKILKNLNYNAPYIYRPSILYNNSLWDTGDNTIQCTRRPEVAKIWFLWKVKGILRLQNHIDYTHNLTKAASNELQDQNSSFELILNEFESSQIAFYYIPKGIRHLSKVSREKALKLSRYTENLRALLIRQGVMIISVDSLPESKPNDRPPFFMMNLKNSALTIADVKYLLDQIQFYGEENTMTEIIKKHVNDFQVQPLKSDRSRPKPPPAPSSFPDYVSSPVESLHKEFIQEVFTFMLDSVTFYDGAQKNSPAYIFKTPEELLQLVDFSLANATHGTGTLEQESERRAVLDTVKKVFYYAGHYGHPYYAYQLLQGVDPYTVMADFLLASINSPMLTYEDSPIFTLMERVIAKIVRERVGYIKPNEPDTTFSPNTEAGGLVLNGGSASIQTAQVMAYFKKRPQAKIFGNLVEKRQLVSFVSANGHYASHKGTMFKGMGMNNCVCVPTDERGRMTGATLRKAVLKVVSEGKIPFFVVVTMGTTVLGAIDLIDEIADVCAEFDMWLHADGAYMGATIFTLNETRRLERFKGIERSDSFNFNLNKGFASSRECSIFVTKDKDALKTSLANDASSLSDDLDSPELFPANQNVDLNPSKISWIHERRASVLKIWFLIKAKGFEGLSQHLEQDFNMVKQATAELKRRGDSFILALPTFQALHVNFYYVPKRLRGMDIKSKEFKEAINDVQYEIQKRILLKQNILIANVPVNNSAGYLILALVDSALSMDDVNYLLDLIEYYGKDL